MNYDMNTDVREMLGIMKRKEKAERAAGIVGAIFAAPIILIVGFIAVACLWAVITA